MAGSARSTTIFRFKNGTGGADVSSAPPVRIDRYASSRRWFALLRLQAAEIIRRLLRMRRRAENRPLVVLQHLQPVGDIGGVIVAGFGRNAKIGTKESRADFRDLS